MAGPPCETWSRARENSINADHATGPRVLRDATHLWGYDALRIKELNQIILGNELLLFAFEAVLELVPTQGIAMIEHPAEPERAESASIWRTPFAKKLLDIEGIELCNFAQGLLGAPTPKPTCILTLNSPGLISVLHRWRVRRELPQSFALGLNEKGEWRTSVLKEYPPAMCGALAEALLTSLCAIPILDVSDPSPAELQLWQRLNASHYGQHIGPDFAG